MPNDLDMVLVCEECGKTSEESARGWRRSSPSTTRSRPAARSAPRPSSGMGGRRAAGITAVSTLMLAGCGVGVDVYVKEYEGGDVEVKSCHKIGDTITDAGAYPDDAEDGASEDEVWKCTIRDQDSSVGSADKCYVVHESKVKTIVRGVKCSSGG